MNTNELFLNFEQAKAFGSEQTFSFNQFKPEEILIGAREYLKSDNTLTKKLSITQSTPVLHNIKTGWLSLLNSTFSEINISGVNLSSFDELILWLENLVISQTPTICD